MNRQHPVEDKVELQVAAARYLGEADILAPARPLPEPARDAAAIAAVFRAPVLTRPIRWLRTRMINKDERVAGARAVVDALLSPVYRNVAGAREHMERRMRVKNVPPAVIVQSVVMQPRRFGSWFGEGNRPGSRPGLAAAHLPDTDALRAALNKLNAALAAASADAARKNPIPDSTLLGRAPKDAAPSGASSGGSFP